MTFVHQFNRRVRCTVHVTDEPPIEGESHIVNFEWTERPKRKHVRQYVQWILEVNRFLADKWDKRIGHVVQVEPRKWEFWGFAPGEAPELVKVIRS
jgi:hypothetical protein